MAMSVIWTVMVAASVVCGLALGNGEAVASAALEGAAAGVELCISMAGALCLWLGVMEIMRRSGLAAGLSRLLRPVLRRLYPDFAQNGPVMDLVSAERLRQPAGAGQCGHSPGTGGCPADGERSPGVASDSLCMLVVCNTASIQLLPTTVASIRSAAGSAAPFDILPAVWLASAASLTAGLLAAKALSKVWR